jgi:hypothetical protein
MYVCRFLVVAPLIVAAIPVAALARDCNEVKTEIDAKIKAKGVANYALQVVNGPEVKEGQIVGNCDAGEKKIVYFKLGEPSASKTLATEKAHKTKLAELSPSDNPSDKSAVDSDFVDRADTLLSQSCVVGNWTGTPRC